MSVATAAPLGDQAVGHRLLRRQQHLGSESSQVLGTSACLSA